jgi:hypothetical protein
VGRRIETSVVNVNDCVTVSDFVYLIQALARNRISYT